MELKKIYDAKGRQVYFDDNKNVIYKRGPALKTFWEWRKLISTYHAGINVPKPIKFYLSGTKATIVMNYIDGIALDEALPAMSNRKKLAIAYKLGNIISNLHKQNFIHCDLHPGNILLDKNQNLVIIDTYKIQKAKCNKQKIDNLALLYGAFIKDAHLKLIWAFLKEYYKDSYGPRIFFKKYGNYIRKRGLTNIFKIIKRETKYFRNDRRFSKLFYKGSFGYLSLKTKGHEHEKVITYWLKIYLEKNKILGNILKNGRSAIIVHYQGLCFKIFKKRRHKWKGLKDYIQMKLKKSKGRISFVKSYIFYHMGGATPTPYGFIETSLGESIYISEYIDGQNASIFFQSLPEDKKELYLHRLFRWVEQILTLGFAHKDFKLNNILVDKDNKLFLIDTIDLCWSVASKKHHEKMLRRLYQDLNEQGLLKVDINPTENVRQKKLEAFAKFLERFSFS